MPKRIVIAGAGGFGRGVKAWLSQSPRHLAEHSIEEVVFIDDNVSPSSTHLPVISTIRDFVPDNNDEVIVAVGVPHIRRAIVAIMSEKATRFHTFIDDRAILAPNVQVGVGAVICPGTVVSADVAVGNHVHINFNCSVGHDTILQEFTTLSPSVNVMGSVSVGREVFIGGSATILPRLRIANQTIIGASAVVVSSVSNPVTIVGNPAREVPCQSPPKPRDR